MKKLTMTDAVRSAWRMGVLCFLSYLAVYVTRNALSVVSPQLIEEGAATNTLIGNVSSVYFAAYAVGQLINGILGDRIKPKYMLGLGMVFSGICNSLFAVWITHPLLANIAYGLSGFFLAMIYGPMVKVAAENVDPRYAARVALGYTIASLFGSPLAGFLAMALGGGWQTVFHITSLILAAMGVICFVVLHLWEQRGIIKFQPYCKVKSEGGSIRLLLQHQIVKFTLVSLLTGIVRTTVVFWLPTYLSQYLGFSAERAALLFTVCSLAISSSAFIAVFLYERLHYNMNLSLFVQFVASAIFFLAVFLVREPIPNMVYLVLAIIAGNGASTILWSVYCPSLRDTGMVSGATGFLDFVSYGTAGISSSLFASATTTIGWSGLILVWFGLMAVGTLVSIPIHKNRSVYH